MANSTPKSGPFKSWRSMALWKQNFIAVIAGLVVCVDVNMSDFLDYDFAIMPLVDLFICGIKMLIVPRVFFSLVTVVRSLDNIVTIGRLSIKTVALHLFTLAFVIINGLL